MDQERPATPRYTKSAPPKKTSERAPVRRRNDALPPVTRSAANQPKKVKLGGTLRSEVVLPVGIGSGAAVAGLGIVAAGASHAGLPIVPIVAAAGVVMIAALLAYVAWIVNSAAAKPLARVRTALQEMEEGNYDARLVPDGAAELAELAEGFNRMVTIVSHQRERMKIAAATDGLTGLANHRHFHERLRSDMHEARERHQPMAVAALDIDGFKKINDERGHARGDEALKLAAEALEKAVRGDDLVSRMGGDDFTILIHGADSAYARDVTERARQAIMRALPDETELTASAGFVCFPDNATDESNLAELANS